ncbi:glycosyltransferase family 39 protein [Curtobacterium sp. 22159]|uniref:glycosyltransferase family 39 protein n=1 Tax=Curtobacterium sp. 22159 TaxID=3453882 RepID=UPI003F850B22
MATEVVSDDRSTVPAAAVRTGRGTAPVGRRELLVVAAVTAGFALVLFLWAAVVPTFQAPDEKAHFDAAVHVAIGDGWPDPGRMHVLEATQRATGAEDASAAPTMGQLLDATGAGEVGTVNQMSQHPPTYYLVAAGVLHLVHFQSLEPSAALLAVRLLSALFVLPLPLLAWATVRRVTRSPRAAVTGAFAVLAVPQLASIGASASNDAPVMLFAATTVWLGARVVTGDRRVRTAVALAVSLGLAIVWKGTALPLIPFVGVALFVGAAGRAGIGSRLVRTLWPLALAAAVGAWWWVRNLLVFHTLQPNGFESLRPPKPFPAGSGPDPVQFANVSWSTIARTFWGSFGGKAQWIISPVVFETATVLALGAVLVWAFRRAPGLRVAITLAVLPVTILVSQTSNSWGSYVSTTFVGATQGRYYFPAIVAFIALSAIAWRRAFGSPAARGRAATVVSSLGAALALYGVLFVYASFAEQSRVRVTPRGLDVLDASSPVAVPVIVTCWVVAFVVLLVAVVASVRVAPAPVTTESEVRA